MTRFLTHTDVKASWFRDGRLIGHAKNQNGLPTGFGRVGAVSHNGERPWGAMPGKMFEHRREWFERLQQVAQLFNGPTNFRTQVSTHSLCQDSHKPMAGHYG